MDVTGITALATQMSQTRQVSDAQISVLKKAMDIEAQGAMQLIQTASQTAPSASYNSPSHLGNNVNTFA